MASNYIQITPDMVEAAASVILQNRPGFIAENWDDDWAETVAQKALEAALGTRQGLDNLED